jgi:hypothetical protein
MRLTRFTGSRPQWCCSFVSSDLGVPVHDFLKLNLQVLHCDPEKASERTHQAFRFSLLKPVSLENQPVYAVDSS